MEVIPTTGPDHSQIQSRILANFLARGLKPGDTMCVAPSVNMYFKFDGSVIACCRNKEQIYGRYPKNNLNEIWEGVSRTSLEQAVSKSIFPTGCADCAENLNHSNHEGMLASRFDSLRVRPRPAYGPSIMEFELGTICNLECVMCNGLNSSSIRKNRDKLPVMPNPYDEEFIRQLRPFIPGLTETRFMGGEPFLNRLNFAVWDLLIELNPTAKVLITTNGTILSNKVKEVIRRLKPHIIFSLESLKPDNYRSIRRNGDLETVKATLDWMHENGALSTIAVCPLRSNWRDLAEISMYGTSIGVAVWFHTVVSPPEHSLKYMSRLELDEIVEVLSKASRMLLPTPHTYRTHHTIVAEDNHRAFRDLVNLVSSWRDQAK